MKVVHITPDLGVGGAERMLVELVKNADAPKLEVAVISLFAARGNWLERELASAGIAVEYLGKRLGFDSRMFLRIHRALRRLRPDVVHTHRSVLRYAVPPLLLARTPVVHTVHSVAMREVTRAGRIVQGVAFRTGVQVVAISSVVATSITSLYGIQPRAIIPNGIHIDTFVSAAKEREEWRAREGIDAGKLVVSCVARLTAAKNVSGILAAFACDAMTHSSAILLLAGDGEMRAALEKEVAYLGIVDRVRFLGSRSDVPALYAASDIIVMFSNWEGGPLTVMEAMAAAKPVIATDVGCVREMMSHGESGIIVAPNNVTALRTALVRLAKDPIERRRIGDEAAQKARKHFDVRSMARAYEQVYCEIYEESQKA